MVSHRSHGRDLGNGTSYLESVGNFAVNYPLGLRTHADEPWREAVRGIQRGLEAVPLHGVSFDLVADRLPAHLYPDTHLTPVRVNYLGNRSIATNPVFEFDKDHRDQRYAPPDQRRTTLIEVFLSVADGALHVEVEYSRHFHTAATIEHLGRRYLDLFESLLRDANENVPKAAERVEAAVVDLEIRRTAGRGKSLSGKVAIVTGAGRGIGRAIARAFASEGARIALISRSPAQLEEAVAEVRAIHPEAVGIAADVTSEEEVRHAVDEVLARFGAIDILVNNAGINFSSLLVESDPAEWRSIIDVNVLGTYHCCRAILPHLQTRGTGKIVNLGSAASVIGYPLFSAYSAAKHAVLGITKALAEEVKQANIQVNAVCPSFVDTRMTPTAFRGNAIPTREIAEIVLFLCSPQSDSITGESINVFGKQDMYSYGSERLSLIQAITKDFRPGIN